MRMWRRSRPTWTAVSADRHRRRDYGQGSSRDWAAKGVRPRGVEAIVAEGFERIHRTNLIGMGVLPLEFKGGHQPQDARIDGTETYDVVGERRPRRI